MIIPEDRKWKRVRVESIRLEEIWTMASLLFVAEKSSGSVPPDHPERMVLVGENVPDLLRQTASINAGGCLHFDDGIVETQRVVQAVLDGGRGVLSHLAQAGLWSAYAADQQGLPPQISLASCELTERELEVLALIARKGRIKDKEIANVLGIAFSTAKHHMATLLEKLRSMGVTNVDRHKAKEYAIGQGWISENGQVCVKPLRKSPAR
jgi:DNA-binding NarL/FixJ family response regulator